MISEEQESYSYGCIMAGFGSSDEATVKRFQRCIPENYLYHEGDMEGMEPHPHMTIKYGLKIDTFDQFPIHIPFGMFPLVDLPVLRVDYFDSASDYDVLKLVPQAPKSIHKLREYIESRWECVDKYPVYQPHITLAYLKKGYGKRFMEHVIPGCEAMIPKHLRINKFIISLPNKVKLQIPLK